MTLGLWGAAIILGAGAVALLLPSPEAIRHGGFFLLFGGLAAGMGALIQSATTVLIVAGTLLLLLDLFLMFDPRPRSDGWRSAVVAQAIAGGAGGVISTVFLALVIVNFVLWIIIFTLLAVIVFGVVMALLQDG